MTVFQAHLLELIVVSTLIQGNCTQAGEKVRGLILDMYLEQRFPYKYCHPIVTE